MVLEFSLIWLYYIKVYWKAGCVSINKVLIRYHFILCEVFYFPKFSANLRAQSLFSLPLIMEIGKSKEEERLLWNESILLYLLVKNDSWRKQIQCSAWDGKLWWLFVLSYEKKKETHTCWCCNISSHIFRIDHFWKIIEREKSYLYYL